MNKQIFKKCKMLGKYWGMCMPYVKYPDQVHNFYEEHIVELSNEGMMYGQINNDREKLGGDIKIHGIYEKEK